MANLIVELSKYALIILMALYTILACTAFSAKTVKRKKGTFLQMMFITLVIHFVAFIVLYVKLEDKDIYSFYLAQLGFLIIFYLLSRVMYKKSSHMITNHMALFMVLGFIMLTRISYDKAVRQFMILVISACIYLFVPFIIRKCQILTTFTWFYGALGCGMLLVVLLLSKTTYGANLSISIGGVSVQPSEFVKLIFVFFIAGMLVKGTNFRQVVITTALAGIHVLILVLSNDLGAGLLFFISYLTMLYIASGNVLYYLGGLGGGCLAGMVGYKLFAHVRRRVSAFRNPWERIDTDGFQTAQSLFAIGTGSWLGMGLCQGSPTDIPFVEKDSMFSAIAEEMGGIFALCLMMVYLCCVLACFRVAMKLENTFYRLVAMGLGTMFGVQVFLTIGGAVKFIPLTGVTLPFISYGGSSLLSCLILFGIMQGIYMIEEDEEIEKEEESESVRADGEESQED